MVIYLLLWTAFASFNEDASTDWFSKHDDSHLTFTFNFINSGFLELSNFALRYDRLLQSMNIIHWRYGPLRCSCSVTIVATGTWKLKFKKQLARIASVLHVHIRRTKGKEDSHRAICRWYCNWNLVLSTQRRPKNTARTQQYHSWSKIEEGLRQDTLIINYLFFYSLEYWGL